MSMEYAFIMHLSSLPLYKLEEICEEWREVRENNRKAIIYASIIGEKLAHYEKEY